ncbi:MAG: hypothetical protein A2176_13900 [Spirochaetes bacterium RBG_13_51_14]|nr:MAG: hypothetical protein A2176_13900 [Spirochaetes bacterium RBG_13_51_14]
MKLEDCKKCEYHYKSQLDDILCVYSGGFDYQVVTQNKKGQPIVVMCPLEVTVPKKEHISAANLKSLLNNF